MRALVLISVTLGLVGCVAAPEGDGQEDGIGDTDVAIGDDKADAPGELRTRIDGLTVWVDPNARIENGRWVLEGRASRNLAAVHSWVPDDAFASAAMTSARKFTITFASGHEQNTLASGLPIFVSLTPVTGDAAQAAIWVAPRLGRSSGSSRIYLHTTIKPVWVGGELMYRGGATVTAPWSGLTITTAAGTPPQLTEHAPRKFSLDWRFEDLAALAPLTGTPVRATSYRDADIVERVAGLDLRVTRLGLTRRDPRDVWATSCTTATQACLAALPAGTVDAGACGTYREVTACGGIPISAGPTSATLVADLRGYLVTWYAAHGTDATSSGGNSLAAAQGAVDPSRFEEVLDPDEDPYAHDLATFRVFRHPDVVWPGSDIVWFVAYDRATSAFVEAYDFN